MINFKYQVLDVIEHPTSEFTNQTDLLNTIVRDIKRLKKSDKIKGIGISCPGPCDRDEGIILTPTNFLLIHNFPIVRLLQKHFDYPIYLDKNTSLLALTEHHIGIARNYVNAMFVSISDTIGASIIQNGQIYRGSSGFAGEFGHISINLNGPKCACGNEGCLEMYVSLARVKQKFNDTWRGSFSDIVDSAYKNDAASLKILDYLASHLATGIISAVNILDIDAIIIYGRLNYRHDLLFEMIEDYVNSRYFLSKRITIQILPSMLNDQEPNNANFFSCAAHVFNYLFMS